MVADIAEYVQTVPLRAVDRTLDPIRELQRRLAAIADQTVEPLTRGILLTSAELAKRIGEGKMEAVFKEAANARQNRAR